MIFRNRMNEKNLMLTGLAFLVLANLARWLLRPTPGFDQELLDGAYGVLFGVSIGCLLLSVWRRRRRSSGEETRADGER